MIRIDDWATDLLVSQGALVDREPGGLLRAMVPPEVAAALGAGEWLSLNFSAGPGADDPVEWTERLGRLLPATQRVAGARLRRWTPPAPVDPEAVLDRKLVMQNGIYRLVQSSPGQATYFWFLFEYSLESDERNVGAVPVCLNATADSVVPQPDALLSYVRDELEDEPDFQIPAPDLRRLFPAAADLARRALARAAAQLVDSANRRLARDTARLEAYYAGLTAQLQKRIAKASGEAAREKERSRLAATELDRVAKLEDLVRKFSPRARLNLAGLLVLTLPVEEMTVRLIHKKEERVRTFHWNHCLHLLEPPRCERCSEPAAPLQLCERMHCLCRECRTTCPRCGRQNCRICRPRCPCGEEQG